jgi:adenine-specific DNA methylase
LLVGAVTPPTKNFWKAYYEDATLKGLTVLDPFVGGGTSVVEASRLGARAIGVDVDPIACAITELELRAGSLTDLWPAFEGLRDTVGDMLAPFHVAEVPGGPRLTILHHFWVQEAVCGACGESTQAHPNYLLADDHKVRWVVCAHCGEVVQLRPGQERFTCRACRERTVVQEGTVRGGALTCRVCGEREPLIEQGRRTGRPPRWQVFAVEALDPRTSGARVVPLDERIFLRAGHREQALYRRAEERLALQLQSDLAEWLPAESIPAKNRDDDRLLAYGYTSWTQLFNARQLLHLATLAKAIAQTDETVRKPLAMAFSNHLTTNCMLTAYAAGWRRLTPLFSVRAFRHVPRPVELNPWVSGTGRGSFPNAVRQLMRAAEYARNPREPRRRGGFRSVPVQPQSTSSILCRSSRDLSFLPAQSVDLVLTDPPYFDNVAYSELADFFAPWLKLLKALPRGRTQTKSETLLAKRRDRARVHDFERRLGDVFEELGRVLKVRGILAFTFRHSTAEGWAAMGQALARAGLRPIQVLPLPGEVGVGLQAYDGTSLWDAVLVLRKDSAANVGETAIRLDRRTFGQATARADEWRERLSSRRRLPFGDADHVNLRRAFIVATALGLYGAGRRDIELGAALQ